MNLKVQRRFAALERSKSAMLETLRGWTALQMVQRPTEDAWSAAEVVDHIARTEDGIFEAVEANLAAPHPVARRDKLGSFVVRCVLRSPLKVKVPEGVIRILPEQAVTAEAAMAAWGEARGRWSRLVHSVTPTQSLGGVFSHPRGGWMSLADTVLFLRLHHDHHLPQLARIRRVVEGV